jgi:putative MATE family efflux protein
VPIPDFRRFAHTSAKLLKLALPLSAGMLFQVAFNLVDAYFIGRIGTDAFAAVNLASFSIWLLSAVIGVVGTGTNARIAQAKGAGRNTQMADIRSQALRVTLVLGFITTFVGLLGAEHLTSSMSNWERDSQYASILANGYLSTILIFCPIMFLNEVLAAIFRGEGDTRTPTYIMSAGFVLNAVLDPLLIYGWGPVPSLGVVGAAIASALSFCLVLALFVWVRKSWFRNHEVGRPLRFDKVPHILKIGIPPSITNIVFCVIYMLVTPYIATQGTEALAALGLGHKVISISYFLCLSFELAAITMTGEATGAEDREEARYRSWVVVATSVLANLAVGGALLFFAADICSVFSNDIVVLGMATSYLYIVVPSQVLLGIGMSVEGAFAGYGRTTTPMIISVISSLLRWPAVAWIVYQTELGIQGVWWVFAISTYMRGLGLLGLLIFDRKNVAF